MPAKNKIAKELIRILDEADEPLETREIEERLPTETRAKIFRCLTDLVIEGVANGRRVGAARGTWIWWRKNAFAHRMDNS